MAVTTLSVTRNDIARYVARKNYWDASSLTAEQTTNMADIIASGERMFYYPRILPGESAPHVWSFMRPTFRTTILANIGDYDLPQEFAGFDGPLSFADWDSSEAITEINRALLDRKRQQTATAPFKAQPVHFSTSVDSVALGQPAEWKLAFWPIPDQDYEILGLYTINPSAITSSTHYPLGGQPHAETLIKACLAASEAIMEDTAGVDTALFMEHLRTSVAWDRRMTGGKTGGRVTDGPRSPRIDRAQYVLYNGQLDPE